MWSYAVLAFLSECCPPPEGRLPTRYSPVRHCTHPRRDFLVRLACVRPAANVRSEPGSNSPVENLVLRLLGGFSPNDTAEFVPTMDSSLPKELRTHHWIRLLGFRSWSEDQETGPASYTMRFRFSFQGPSRLRVPESKDRQLTSCCRAVKGTFFRPCRGPSKGGNLSAAGERVKLLFNLFFNPLGAGPVGHRPEGMRFLAPGLGLSNSSARKASFSRLCDRVGAAGPPCVPQVACGQP